MLVLLGLVGYLLFLMGAGWLVNYLMSPLFGRFWRLFVAPGVIVHELAHAFACLLTGAQILEINFWKVSGGHVMHTQPRLHILGPVLISFAPTLVMTIGLFALLPMLGGELDSLPWVQTVPASATDLFMGYFASLWLALRYLDWLTITPWLLVYGMLNVAVTITPSATDLHNAKWAFLALLIVTALLIRLFSFSVSLGWLWPAIATTFVLLGLALVVCVLVRLPDLVFRSREKPTV